MCERSLFFLWECGVCLPFVLRLLVFCLLCVCLREGWLVREFVLFRWCIQSSLLFGS